MKRTFLDNIRKGLGRAYLELRNAANKEKYLDTLVFACLHDSSYDCATIGPKSDFLYELIKLYDAATIEKIKHIIIDSLNVYDKRNLMFQKLELLLEYYRDGNKDILNYVFPFYEKFIANVKNWTVNRLEAFEILAMTIDKLYGLKKTKEVVKFIKNSKINQAHFDWYSNKLEYRYKNSMILEFVKQVKDAEEGKSEKETWTSGKLGFALRLLDLPNSDLLKLCNYLKSTNNINAIKMILRAFKLARGCQTLPDKIYVFLLEKYGDLLKKDVYNAMAYNESKYVENLGLSLIKTKEYQVQGLIMLFNNYSIQYRHDIIDVYKKIDFSFFDSTSALLTDETIRFMSRYRDQKDYISVILFINYEKSYDSELRYYVVDLMKRRKIITKDIINEIKFDSNYDIREIAYKK